MAAVYITLDGMASIDHFQPVADIVLEQVNVVLASILRTKHIHLEVKMLRVIILFLVLHALVACSTSPSPQAAAPSVASPEERVKDLYGRIGTSEREQLALFQGKSKPRDALFQIQSHWSVFKVHGDRISWCSARTPNLLRTYSPGSFSAIRTRDTAYFLVTNPMAKPRRQLVNMRIETQMTTNEFHTFDVPLSYFNGESIFTKFTRDEPGYMLLSGLSKGHRIYIRLINDPVPGMSREVGVYENDNIDRVIATLNECVATLGSD